jgi:hypothetical protein
MRLENSEPTDITINGFAISNIDLLLLFPGIVVGKITFERLSGVGSVVGWLGWPVICSTEDSLQL